MFPDSPSRAGRCSGWRHPGSPRFNLRSRLSLSPSCILFFQKGRSQIITEGTEGTERHGRARKRPEAPGRARESMGGTEEHGVWKDTETVPERGASGMEREEAAGGHGRARRVEGHGDGTRERVMSYSHLAFFSILLHPIN